MSDPTRGITCPDTRKVVREALRQGWCWEGFTGTTHCVMRWPATGDVVRFGTTPSVASFKSLAKDIERVSGITVYRKGNRKRSRKAPQRSGYNPLAVAQEQAAWHADHDEQVAALVARRDRLIAECQQFARNRARLRDIPAHLSAIADVEASLRRMAQPVEPFDPFTLAPR